MTEEDGAEAHVITLDVAEAYRRAGTGTALLVEMERRLAGRGVKRVTLETAVNNEAGFAFWQRHGYSTVGVFKRYYLERLDAYHMVKVLPSSDARSARGHVQGQTKRPSLVPKVAVATRGEKERSFASLKMTALNEQSVKT